MYSPNKYQKQHIGFTAKLQSYEWIYSCDFFPLNLYAKKQYIIKQYVRGPAVQACFPESNWETYHTVDLRVGWAYVTCWRTPRRLSCTKYQPPDNQSLRDYAVKAVIISYRTTQQIDTNDDTKHSCYSQICPLWWGWSRVRFPPPRTGSYLT